MKNLKHSSRILAGTQMGKELFRIEDDRGEIVVTQRGDKRVLSFGSGMEQSSVYINKPYYLAHEYTQVMLLGLVFVDVKHTTMLGLGGGGLATCLNHYFKSMNIQIVELRQAVIDVAYEWFLLPRNDQVNVCHDDAFQYLLREKPKSTDLIFSDLYEANGMSELQEQNNYIESCYEVLSENGCLVLNLHTDPQAELSLMCTLHNLFENIRMCHIINGNWVLFCEKSATLPCSDTLNSRVKLLLEQVKMPLMYYYRNMRVVN